MWRVQDGYFGGTPTTIGQTADGGIWIGIDAGLFKFDGVRFVRWNVQLGKELPSSSISSLLGARDGSLWIGTDTRLIRLADNRLILYEEASLAISKAASRASETSGRKSRGDLRCILYHESGRERNGVGNQSIDHRVVRRSFVGHRKGWTRYYLPLYAT